MFSNFKANCKECLSEECVRKEKLKRKKFELVNFGVK